MFSKIQAFQFIRTTPNYTFLRKCRPPLTIRPPPTIRQVRVHRIRGLKLLTRLRVGLSHLREHKFYHKFHDTLDPLCSCRSNSIESVEHFLLHCPNYSTYRYYLFDNLRQKEILILLLTFLVQILLFGNNVFKGELRLKLNVRYILCNRFIFTKIVHPKY